MLGFIKAKHRRRIHFIVFLIALVPGGIASLMFSRAIPWLVFMSWVSFWYAPLTAFSGETPVEKEDES